MPLFPQFFAALSAVHAAPIVLYTESSDEAKRTVKERVPAANDVLAWPLSALRSRPPYVVGSGTARVCASQAEVPLGERLAEARQHIGLVQLDSASALLSEALDVALCDPIAASTIAEIWFLTGMVAFYREDISSAKSAFRNALIAVPDLVWDEQFADGRDLFTASTPGESALRLSLLPETRIWSVDGRPARPPLSLAAGSHIIEVGEGSPIAVRVDVEGRGEATLVLPALLPDSVLLWAKRPERWHDLSLVLAGAPEATAVGLYAAPDLFWAEDPRGPYQHFSPPPAPEAPPERRPFPRWALGLGGAGLLGAAGATICTIGGLRAQRDALAASGSSYESFSSSLDRAHHYSACVAASDAVALLGLGSAAVGTIGWVSSR